MDILRQKQSSSWQKTSVRIGSVILLLSLLIFGYQLLASDQYQISSKDIWLGQAQMGTLNLEVQGYGKLKSKHQRLLTARTSGIVEEIQLKPGAAVKEGDVIMRLLNPDLDQQVTNERLLFRAAEANLRQNKVNNKRETLAQRAYITQLEAEYHEASFNLEAMSKLVSSGVISALDHKRAQLKTDQLQKRLNIEHERLTQLKTVHKESINIQYEKVIQQRSQLTSIEAKQDQLFIKANITGVLQKVDVELGQRVSLGDILAFVGGTDQLIAEINIPQSQVEQLSLGQHADISTRNSISNGIVTRIDPVVTAGNVVVEIELVGDLPSDARPDLTVDATIKAGAIENIVFIERPVNAQPGSTSTLFRLDTEQNIAHSVEITFGAEAGRHIQVIQGASQGDHFILSDTSRWQQFESVAVN